MSQPTNLTTFLAARLDEDEAAARYIEDRSEPWRGRWEADENHRLRTYNGWTLAVPGTPDGEFAPGVLAHITRHDPARVLREVEAGRRVIAAHPIRPIPNGTCEACSAPDGFSYLADLEEFIDWPCPTLRALAAIWRDHPDYPWRGHEGG